MKAGETIRLNGGNFNVVYVDKHNEEIVLQRATHPHIEVSGELTEEGIKLNGWTNFLPYTTIN